MIIKEVIVVEGRDDTTAIKRAVNADTIETGGSAINESIINKIRKVQKQRGVIILTDPDYPGEKIRKYISNRVPGVKHAFIKRSDAKGLNDIGVENANPDIIRKALKEAKAEWIDDIKETISWDQLIDLGLVGEEKAKINRAKLCDILGIGYCNGKQLYKRLKAFQINEREFFEAISRIDKEE